MSGNVAIQGTSRSTGTPEGTSAPLAALKQYSVIRPDSSNNSAATIAVVREKLVALGRLDENDESPDSFFAAVRQYQADKGLKLDGIVGQQTLASLVLDADGVAPGTKLLSKAPVVDARPEFSASTAFIQNHLDEYNAGTPSTDNVVMADAAYAQVASTLTEAEMMAQGMEVISRGAAVVGGTTAAAGAALALRNPAVRARAVAAVQTARQTATQLATQGGARAAAAGTRTALQAAGAAIKANPGAVLKGVAGKALPVAGVAYMAWNFKEQATSDKATWKKVANGMAVVAGACALVPGIGWGAAALLTVGSIGLSMV